MAGPRSTFVAGAVTKRRRSKACPQGQGCPVAFCRAGCLRSGRNVIGYLPFALRANADLTGELVAPASYGADQVAVRAKRFAQSDDFARQSALVDNAALPGDLQELVLADNRPRGFDQRHQHIKGAAAERYRPAVGYQLAAMREDAEVAKFDDRQRIRLANHERDYKPYFMRA